MDADLVMSYTEISPGAKRMFLELRGLPPRRVAHLPYLGGLIGQGLYNLGNVGPVNTLRFTSNFFEKRKAREAKGFVEEDEKEA